MATKVVTEKVVAKDLKDLKKLIKDAITKNGPECDLNFIDVSKVTDMSGMFNRSQFNGDISKWNISKVTEMSSMFQDSKFDKDISNWNIGHIATDSRQFMFKNCGYINKSSSR